MSSDGRAGFPLEGARAFVTGGNRGLGKALVEALRQRGAARVYVGARSVESSDPGGDAIRLDVTHAASVAAAAAACPDVNLLINNAGYVQHGNALDVPDLAAARREMEVNYWGVLNCCRAFAPGLIAAGGGAIVNVLSIAALASLRGVGTYSASKAAALSLSQDLRGQLAEKGVQVTAVIAGPILTDMARDAAGRHPAIAVAGAILDGVAAGSPLVFPDPVSASVGADYGADPWSLERRFQRGSTAS